jgi:hypothetical protein
VNQKVERIKYSSSVKERKNSKTKRDSGSSNTIGLLRDLLSR